MLLLAGDLSLRALQKSRAIDLGFSPSGLLMASYDLELRNYPVEPSSPGYAPARRILRRSPGHALRNV